MLRVMVLMLSMVMVGCSASYWRDLFHIEHPLTVNPEIGAITEDVDAHLSSENGEIMLTYPKYKRDDSKLSPNASTPLSGLSIIENKSSEFWHAINNLGLYNIKYKVKIIGKIGDRIVVRASLPDNVDVASKLLKTGLVKVNPNMCPDQDYCSKLLAVEKAYKEQKEREEAERKQKEAKEKAEKEAKEKREAIERVTQHCEGLPLILVAYAKLIEDVRSNPIAIYEKFSNDCTQGEIYDILTKDNTFERLVVASNKYPTYGMADIIQTIPDYKTLSLLMFGPMKTTIKSELSSKGDSTLISKLQSQDKYDILGFLILGIAIELPKATLEKVLTVLNSKGLLLSKSVLNLPPQVAIGFMALCKLNPKHSYDILKEMYKK